MSARMIRLVRPRSDRMQAALNLPNGARFYRCALQVNPFAYLKSHDKPTQFKSEEEYNKAIVETCLEVGIEVIAVTDHYRVKHSASLVHTARNAGLYAFNGFEAVTKDGVHFLCLFDPDKDETLERFIGECGIHSTDQPSPTGSKDSSELLECAKNWGGRVHCSPCCLGRWVAEEALGTIESQCLDQFQFACLCTAWSDQCRAGRDQADPQKQGCRAQARQSTCNTKRLRCQ